MRTLLVTVLCFCSTLLKAQLDLPITWYANKRTTTQYCMDTLYMGPRANPDTLLLPYPLVIYLSSSSLKVGLETFQVEAITWPTNKDNPSKTQPEVIVANCKNNVIVIFFGKSVDIRYSERNGWRREVVYE